MQRLVPVEVVGLTNAVSIATGANHTCAVTSNGVAKCWGYNAYGQVGDGATTSRYLPVDVVGLSSGVASIATGTDHTCASLSSGALKCWGYNWQGQLGDGTRMNRSTPVDVVGLSTGVAEAAAGNVHSCARMSNGTIKCWGGNSAGQLGDGTGSPHYTPANVVGIGDAIAFTAGGSHTCAIRQGGQAQCWGYNGTGAVGDGTIIDRWMPTNVQSIGSVSATAAGMAHTCAVTSDQAIKCWGYNVSGQLGNGVLLSSSTPLAVPGFT
jgi:alpha-tubulin suppressor-like RCC1 family protein